MSDEKEWRIAVLKANLTNTDYITLKYTEGEITAEEWLPVKEQRATWRKELEELEKGI